MIAKRGGYWFVYDRQGRIVSRHRTKRLAERSYDLYYGPTYRRPKRRYYRRQRRPNVWAKSEGEV